jgi:uncharacterized protein (DUF2141 family)
MRKPQNWNGSHPGLLLVILACASVWMLGCQDAHQSDSAITRESSTSETEKPASESPDVIDSTLQSNTVSTDMLIHVKITGFSSSQGKCCVAAYLTSKGFNKPEFAFRKETLDIEGDSANWQLQLELDSEEMAKYLESGTGISLAISAYHDNNGNAKLDKNALGMPTERYGFSRNPKHGFGPPKFADAMIQVSEKELNSVSPVHLEVPIEVN